MKFLQEHLNDIYGYAINRTFSTDDAQDLSGEIVLNILLAYRKNPELCDNDSYLWKLVHNVYVSFVRKQSKHQSGVELDQISNMISDADSVIEENLLFAEDKVKLISEIARLSDIRRKIIVLHYFKELKLQDISAILHIPVGTIKWHLNGSKLELKKGMDSVRTSGKLSINPIEFSGISYSGNEGDMGGPQTLLKGKLRQNILYCAYSQPMTINEIRDELVVSPVFVRDEVTFLCDYDFMTDFGNGTYQTNIIILTEPKRGSMIDIIYQNLENECKVLSEKHCVAMRENKQKLLDSGICFPNGDLNFLYWTAFLDSVLSSVDMKNLCFPDYPIRKDGGRYLVNVFAKESINENEPWQTTPYSINGPMINWKRQVGDKYFGMWRVDSFWSDRPMLEKFGHFEIETCSKFAEGKLPFCETNAEVYKQMLDRGLLIKTDDGYVLNIVFAKDYTVYRKYKDALLNIPNIYTETINRIRDMAYSEMKKSMPAHIDSQLRDFASVIANYTISPLIIKSAVDSGFLIPPTELQKKSISILVGQFEEADM